MPILTFFRTQITRSKPKIVFYRNYKHFEKSRFLENLNSSDFSLKADDPNENFNIITGKFLDVANRHAPLKKKKIRGSKPSFMTKELRKEIYTKSKSNNKYNRNPTEEKKAIYTKQRNKYVPLRRKPIKVYFNNMTKTSVQTYKEFWKLI